MSQYDTTKVWRCSICRLMRWLRLDDYEDAKREAVLKTIAETGRD